MSDPDSLHIPPHSIPAEQAIIAGLLRDNAAHEWASVILQASDFYTAPCRVLWTAISELLASNRPADIITVAEYLDKTGRLDDAGGMAYLWDIHRAHGVTANIRAYAHLIRENAMLRALITNGSAQIDAAHNPDGSTAAELIAAAQAKIAALAERGTLGSGWTSAGLAANQAIERIETLYAKGGGMVGVSTGWADLDQRTRGLEPGSLIIVAARPSMGKTTLALQMAEQVASKSEYPVAFFSLEMSKESLAMRLMASLGKVNHDRLRSAELENEELHRLTPAATKINRLNLEIDDQSGLSVAEISARSRNLHRERGGLAMICIDYLGLIAMPEKVENQNLGISKITAAMKGLAKDLEVPIVLLSQLNREVEKRANKRPIMSDLRDSGSIEQDADLILFIYRDEVYNENTQEKGIAEINTAKHRNGQTGTDRLAWRGQYCRFDDLAPGWAPDPPRQRAKSYDY